MCSYFRIKHLVNIITTKIKKYEIKFLTENLHKFQYEDNVTAVTSACLKLLVVVLTLRTLPFLRLIKFSENELGFTSFDAFQLIKPTYHLLKPESNRAHFLR